MNLYLLSRNFLIFDICKFSLVNLKNHKLPLLRASNLTFVLMHKVEAKEYPITEYTYLSNKKCNLTYLCLRIVL